MKIKQADIQVSSAMKGDLRSWRTASKRKTIGFEYVGKIADKELWYQVKDG